MVIKWISGDALRKYVIDREAAAIVCQILTGSRWSDT